MYAERKDFIKPDNENIKIWRYLDFTKFISLLDKRALFFARADKFNDPFEGSTSKANVQHRPEVYKDSIAVKYLDQISKINKEFVKFTIINCWHINEYESAAMWKLYLKSNEGIAIQSTFKRLADSFNDYNDEPINIGKVKYIDYEKDWLPERKYLYPFFHKRKSFEHEQELRAIICKIPSDENSMDEVKIIDFSKEVFHNGEYIPINLDILLQKIYISPTAPEWFVDAVKSIVKKFELDVNIVHSKLMESPVY